MNALPTQEIRLSTTRHALLVMVMCYVPHYTIAPGWLFIVILTAISYRLVADYFAYPIMHYSIRFLLVVGCLFLLKLQYGSIISSGFFISFLLLFVGLKSIEVHTIRDLKVLVLCNFYLIFSALIVIQELWIIGYMFIAILANLSLMLKIAAPKASLTQIGRNSIKPLLLALPISVLLFYLFPRIADPLWQVPSMTASQIGFSEEMTPGSIAELFGNDTLVMRITFKKAPVVNGYWRGLILNFYNGESWNSLPYYRFHLPPLPQLPAYEMPDYEVLLEPHQKKWLFYLGNPKTGRPDLLFFPNQGLMSANFTTIKQRFAYALTIGQPPQDTLSVNEYQQNTQMLASVNPRLNEWAKKEFLLKNNNVPNFISFLKEYINQQPFWYTLTPPTLTNRNQMDQFWFNTQKGYCEQYASAVALILRAVGIPARVVVGYQGGEWNPIAQYLTIVQNDAHAWVEYWQEGAGWQQFDPTSFIAPERVDQSIKDRLDNRMLQGYSGNMVINWLQTMGLYWESARFFAERWILFYNNDTQRDLLDKLGLGQWTMQQLLQTTIACLILFIILFSLYYHWQQKRALNPLIREYHLLQKEFRRFNVSTSPSATLKQQCQELSDKAPDLESTLSVFLTDYEKYRLQPMRHYDRDDIKATLNLFKKLRKQLVLCKPSQYYKQKQL